MRRVPFLVLALCAVTTTASAQSQAVVMTHGTSDIKARMNPEAVVSRVMTFDRNRDGRVVRSELAERMHDLVVKGDADGDAALNAAEIRLMAARSAEQTLRNPFLSGHYSFADPVGTTSRSHIERAVDDLRLEAATRELAIAVIDDYLNRRQQPALYQAREIFRPLVTTDQLAKIMLLLQARHRAGALLPVMEDTQLMAAMIVRTTEMGRLVEQLAPPSGDRDSVRKAISQFDAAVRIDDVARRTLLEELTDVLTEDQRDDFRAALERRPVVSLTALIRDRSGNLVTTLHLGTQAP